MTSSLRAGLDASIVMRWHRPRSDRALRPDGPLAEQASEKCRGRPLPPAGNGVSSAGHDRIIVSRVERDVRAPALSESRRHVERAVAVERRYLDRDTPA